MIRSGRSSGTVAERPSVKSSKRLISLTRTARLSAPSRSRMRLVTISVREAGSKRSARSKTRTLTASAGKEGSGEKSGGGAPTTTNGAARNARLL